jgi:RNA polymerase sigma-70 factor (ECF subfamily)
MAKPAALEEDDRALVQRCAAGERAALGQLYRRHHRRVFNVVVRMVGPQEAEEVAQDAFVRIFKGLKRFRGDSSLSTWIYRVAMNVCLTHLSRRSRRVAVRDEYAKQHEPVRSVDTSPWLREHLRGALDQLPPGYRAVLVLHDVEGLNHQEIGKILGCREGTSKSQLHKARMRMRELLEPVLDHPGGEEKGG